VRAQDPSTKPYASATFPNLRRTGTPPTPSQLRRRSRPVSSQQTGCLLDCDPETGILTWKTRPGCPKFNNRYAGKPAGSPFGCHGYIRIGLDKCNYLAHRLVWLHAKGWLPATVDHYDGNRQNNAISNLRPASYAQNNQNTGKKRTCDLPRGCYLLPSGHYRVSITAHGQRYEIGVFATVEAAERAHREALADLHGEFAFVERPPAQPTERRVAR
jgi:hypothetical protein